MDNAGLSRYLLTMAICHVLIERKLLRMDEYFLFEKRMCDKYGLSPKSIFRDKYVLFRH